ncbi:MAG: Uma2 family endonuclease [Desulfobacterales bacterium]|nr:Uma2 family endonuclease [Desulfobacterales bacterium]
MPFAAKVFKEEKKYTYADYLTWDDNQRWEIIDGEVYDMSPAPSNKHQFIIWEISRQIGNFLFDKTCQGRTAPFDVRFPESVICNDEIIDVVQPDIVVICDSSKLDKRGCHGAPDFIIEISSPSTAYKDYTVKLTLYELNKVKEYWIIDPINKIVTVYTLKKDGNYGKPFTCKNKKKLKVITLEGLEIDLDSVFKAPIFE